MANSIFDSFARRSQQQQVDTLISLLDRYLYERADVSIPFDTNLLAVPKVPTNKITTAETPASLAICPNVSLDDCLEEHIQQCRRREELIAALCQDTKLVNAAHDHLDAEHVKVPSEFKNGEFKNEDFETIAQLSLKLIHIRWSQRAAAEAQENKNKLRVEIVERPNGDGTVALTETMLIGVESRWSEFRTALLAIMGEEKNGQEGEIDANKWIYQVLNEDNVPEKVMYDLFNKAQYETMKSMMANTKARVLIWHEVAWRASRKARKEAEEVQEWGFEGWGEEILNFGGGLSDKDIIVEDLEQLKELGLKDWEEFLAGGSSTEMICEM